MMMMMMMSWRRKMMRRKIINLDILDHYLDSMPLTVGLVYNVSSAVFTGSLLENEPHLVK